MNWKILETERMQLRLLTPSIYADIFSLSDDTIMELLFISDADAFEKEKRKFAKGLAMHNRSFVIFQMIGRDDFRFLGLCGFHTWHVDHARAEIGYHIDRESDKNKGLMTEALWKILEYGFETMQLNRVEALLSPNNKASLALIQKFGFVREGLLRSHYFTNGNYEDSAVFSLLASEFNRVSK